MKNKFSVFIDTIILVAVWIFFVLVAMYSSFIILYFPQFEISGSIITISALLLTVAYTIFWVKRFKKSKSNI